ncbi:hypothetical protein RB195_016964 [Necator americanus]|uniref:Uncharacterized protein n=1 Tax=Necator americanus TaxID=51031 RepID=A0ABR1C2Y8_NECAM
MMLIVAERLTEPHQCASVFMSMSTCNHRQVCLVRSRQTKRNVQANNLTAELSFPFYGGAVVSSTARTWMRRVGKDGALRLKWSQKTILTTMTELWAELLRIPQSTDSEEDAETLAVIKTVNNLGCCLKASPHESGGCGFPVEYSYTGS